MNFLIAAKHPPFGKLPIGGVQTWSATVGRELKLLGHDVTYWGPEYPLPKERFDAGIFANVMHTGHAEQLCEKVIKFSHGVIPDEKGGTDFFATSEEVAKKWGCNDVIRQPIDLEFWTPSGEPKTLLVRHSYRQGLTYLPKIASGMGLDYVKLGGDHPSDVRANLRRAKVVIATGRAALEAMACGASVVIADYRGYQGPLIDCSPFDSMKRNYSGRGGIDATAGNMRIAIDEAVGRGNIRSHVEKHHDSKEITKRILECLLS